MSPGKLAAQAVHASLGLSRLVPIAPEDSVVVLEASDKKFFETVEELKNNNKYEFYVVTDAGYTEVAPGTTTCLSFLEE